MNLDLWKQKLDELGTKVGQANDLVSQYTVAGYQVPDMVKKKVGEIYGNNQDLNTQENALQEQLTTTPGKYAADLTTGRFAGNPILAGQAAAQREAAIEKNLQNIRNMKTERSGTTADIINAGTNAFNAQTAAVQGKAKSLADEYNMAESGYSKAYQEEQDRITKERQARQDEEDRRRYEEDKLLERAKFEESKRQFNVSESRLNKTADDSTTTTQQTLNSVLGQLKGMFTRDKGGADFRVFDPNNNQERILTREQMAEQVQGDTGIDYDTALKLIYDNFKSAQEEVQGQKPSGLSNINFQKLGKLKASTSKLNFKTSEKSTGNSEIDKLTKALGL